MKIILPKFVNHKRPNEGDRIVCCFGKFDLLHPGHISFLKKAKELGDFLIVRICKDDTKTVMNLNERVLNVPEILTVDLISKIRPIIVLAKIVQQVS